MRITTHQLHHERRRYIQMGERDYSHRLMTKVKNQDKLVSAFLFLKSIGNNSLAAELVVRRRIGVPSHLELIESNRCGSCSWREFEIDRWLRKSRLL